MSNILVATDFSSVADNAVRYACDMARDLNTSVTIIHSFIIPVTFSDTPMPVMAIDEGRQIAEDRMQETVTMLRAAYEGLEISGKIMFGEIVDCIEEYTEHVKPWVVVVGNSGSGDTALWLGSNVLSALRNLKHTVMAIPPESTYQKPEKLCFACDFKHNTEHHQIQALLNLVTRTGAQLHVLNVDHNNKSYSSDDALESTELHEALKAANPVYHYVEKENVEEGIESFITANQMNWLVIIPHKHSFIEGLFHKSHTKAIMKKVHIPLVALHEY